MTTNRAEATSGDEYEPPIRLSGQHVLFNSDRWAADDSLPIPLDKVRRARLYDHGQMIELEIDRCPDRPIFVRACSPSWHALRSRLDDWHEQGLDDSDQDLYAPFPASVQRAEESFQEACRELMAAMEKRSTEQTGATQ